MMKILKESFQSLVGWYQFVTVFSNWKVHRSRSFWYINHLHADSSHPSSQWWLSPRKWHPVDDFHERSKMKLAQLVLIHKPKELRWLILDAKELERSEREKSGPLCDPNQAFAGGWSSLMYHRELYFWLFARKAIFSTFFEHKLEHKLQFQFQSRNVKSDEMYHFLKAWILQSDLTRPHHR